MKKALYGTVVLELFWLQSHFYWHYPLTVKFRLLGIFFKTILIVCYLPSFWDTKSTKSRLWNEVPKRAQPMCWTINSIFQSKVLLKLQYNKSIRAAIWEIKIMNKEINQQFFLFLKWFRNAIAKEKSLRCLRDLDLRNYLFALKTCETCDL